MEAEAAVAPPATWTAPRLEIRGPGVEAMPDALFPMPTEPAAEVDSTAPAVSGEDVAGSHETSIAAAEVLESVALRLRRGEILLAPDASLESEAAAVASVLSMLEGARH